MALDIIWTREAKDRLAEIIEYLEDSRSEQMLQQFSRQLDKKLKLVNIID